MTRLICALAFLLLSGCIGGTTILAKPGATQQDFENDRYDCQVMLGYQGHAGGNEPGSQLIDYLARGKAATQRCLERKGWREVQQQEQQPTAAPTTEAKPVPGNLASPYF